MPEAPAGMTINHTAWLVLTACPGTASESWCPTLLLSDSLEACMGNRMIHLYVHVVAYIAFSVGEA